MLREGFGHGQGRRVPIGPRRPFPEDAGLRRQNYGDHPLRRVNPVRGRGAGYIMGGIRKSTAQGKVGRWHGSVRREARLPVEAPMEAHRRIMGRCVRFYNDGRPIGTSASVCRPRRTSTADRPLGPRCDGPADAMRICRSGRGPGAHVGIERAQGRSRTSQT